MSLVDKGLGDVVGKDSAWAWQRTTAVRAPALHEYSTIAAAGAAAIAVSAT